MKSITLFAFFQQAILIAVTNTMAEPIYSDIFRCKKDSRNYQPNSPYKTNLIPAFKKLSTDIANDSYPSFKVASIGQKPNEKVTTIALCAGFITKDKDCSSCVNTTIPMLLNKCPTQIEGVAWRFKCMVAYGEPRIVQRYDAWFLAKEASNSKDKDVKKLDEAVAYLAGHLSKEASELDNPTRYYATAVHTYGSRGYVYMAMQCTPNITRDDCSKCLVYTSGQIKSCCSGAIAAAMLTPNCYMRYANYDFRLL